MSRWRCECNIDYVKVKEIKEITLIIVNNVNNGYNYTENLTILQLCFMFYFHVFRRPDLHY